MPGLQRLLASFIDNGGKITTAYQNRFVISHKSYKMIRKRGKIMVPSAGLT